VAVHQAGRLAKLGTSYAIVWTMLSKVINGLIVIGLALGGSNRLVSQTPRLDWTVEGGGDGYDAVFAVAVNRQGNPIISGFASDTITLSGQTFPHDGRFALLAGMTSTGGVSWLTMLPGAAALQSGIAIDSEDNIYVCGAFATNLSVTGTRIVPKGPMDGYVAKYTSRGSLVWLRSISGDGLEIATSLALDVAGDCYVSGMIGRSSDALPTVFEGVPVNTASGGYSSFLIKLSSNGSKLQTKLIGRFEDETGGYAWPKAIATDAQGNCYLAGDFRGPVAFDGIVLGTGGPATLPVQSEGAFLAKYDPNWNIVWARAAIGSTQSEDLPIFAMFRDIKVDRKGNAYVTGIFTPHLTVGTNELAGEGDWDIVIAKYSAKGDILWAQRAGGQGNDSGERLALTAAGDCLLAGYFQGKASFAGTNVLSQGVQDLFAAAYDGNGNLLWLRDMGTNNSAFFGGGIGLTPTGDVYLGGAVVQNPVLNEIGIVVNSIFEDFDILVAKLSTDHGSSESVIGPTPRVRLEGSQVVVSWSRFPTEFVLESAPSLAADITAWQKVNAVAETDSDLVTVRLDLGQTAEFFRLKEAR